jgi:hypothetical protein
MFCAFDIKSILADHLLETAPNKSILASEVPFCYGFRRADMLFFTQNKVHAFEVKSDIDDLNKLESQLKDYKATFSYHWLVTSEKHLSKARKRTHSSTGIILVRPDKQVKIIRQARENKRLSKNQLIFLLDRKHLTKLMKSQGVFPKNNAIELEKLRSIGENKLTIRQLAQAAYSMLYSRYKRAYELFSFDRGIKTTHDDIYYLSGAK